MTLSKTAGAFSNSGCLAAPARIGLYGKYPEQNSSTATGMSVLARKSVHFKRLPAIVPRLVDEGLSSKQIERCSHVNSLFPKYWRGRFTFCGPICVRAIVEHSVMFRAVFTCADSAALLKKLAHRLCPSIRIQYAGRILGVQRFLDSMGDLENVRVYRQICHIRLYG
jgi:hypothetical protein